MRQWRVAELIALVCVYGPYISSARVTCTRPPVGLYLAVPAAIAYRRTKDFFYRPAKDFDGVADMRHRGRSRFLPRNAYT